MGNGQWAMGNGHFNSCRVAPRKKITRFARLGQLTHESDQFLIALFTGALKRRLSALRRVSAPRLSSVGSTPISQAI